MENRDTKVKQRYGWGQVGKSSRRERKGIEEGGREREGEREKERETERE